MGPGTVPSSSRRTAALVCEHQIPSGARRVAALAICCQEHGADATANTPGWSLTHLPDRNNRSTEASDNPQARAWCREISEHCARRAPSTALTTSRRDPARHSVTEHDYQSNRADWWRPPHPYSLRANEGARARGFDERLGRLPRFEPTVGLAPQEAAVAHRLVHRRTRGRSLFTGERASALKQPHRPGERDQHYPDRQRQQGAQPQSLQHVGQRSTGTSRGSLTRAALGPGR